MDQSGEDSSLGARGVGSGEWPLVTAAEMQALDRQTIESLGVAGGILMESAGRSLVGAALALRASSLRPDGPIRALCGSGNNGGDGFVLARHLHAEGIPTEVILLGDPKRLAKDAAANWRRLEAAQVPRSVLSAGAEAPDWAVLLAETSVLVDALFGTGLTRPLEGLWAETVRACNAGRAGGLRVLAVDIPSGISADTGEVLGTAIEADRTITISLPKVGLALEPGAQHAGEISVARVGIVDPAPLRSDPVALWSRQAAAARLPSRASDGHKGRFGHVLVVAGSTGKAGAGVLTSRAAVRAGAGLVTLAHPVGLEHELGALPVEVMTSPVGEAVEGCLSRASLEALSGLAAARDVVALGPGLGSGAAVVEWVADWVDSLERPLVLDADGLNAIVGRLDGLKRRSAPTVLTPHPGEASRLLGCTTRAINADRVGAARQLARDSGSVVVLKGARTVIADAVGRVRITPTGGPVLATGGTGDVLTGIVAALLAAGLDAFDAAGLAAWWHGAAADGTPQARVGFGLLASEVADALPATAESMRAESGGEPGDPLVLRFP